MSIQRRLPRGIESRRLAIDTAKTKKDNPGGIGNILSAATSSRLDAIKTSYTTAYGTLNASQYALNVQTVPKNTAMDDAKLYISHFLQVFNLGVRRGVYNAAQRSFFAIDVSSDAVPPMVNEAQVLQLGGNITTGDAARVTAGGAAMSNPTAAQANTKIAAFASAHTTYSNLKDGLDVAQENLEALFTEADKVIKKVWDEVETYFNEEEPESMRANAREWGVVYIGIGNVKQVTIHLTMADGSDMRPNLTVRLQDEAKQATDAGDAVYNTTMEDVIAIEVSGTGIQPYSGTVTIQPDIAQTIEVVLEAA